MLPWSVLLERIIMAACRTIIRGVAEVYTGSLLRGIYSIKGILRPYLTDISICRLRARRRDGATLPAVLPEELALLRDGNIMDK